MKAAAVVTAVIVSGVFFVPRSRAEWTRLETGPEERNPRRRQSHAMALNHASGRILLFGGWNDQVGLLDDTWEWDGNGWRRMLPRTVPPARSMHAMAFDSATGKILMFGGMTNIGLRQNDTWSWDGADWTQVATATLPPERSGHVMALDPSTNAIIMFGGHDGRFRRRIGRRSSQQCGTLPDSMIVISRTARGGALVCRSQEKRKAAPRGSRRGLFSTNRLVAARH